MNFPTLCVQPPVLVLIGPPGSGKTEVGARLAQDLGWDFVDSDLIIERTVGLSIPDLFAKHGEEKFRALENIFLEEIAQSGFSTVVFGSDHRQQHGTVLSTGGGMPIPEGNFAILSRLGTLIYLYAEIDVLLERVNRKKNRPLLNPLRQSENAKTRLKSLLDERNHIYVQAEFSVDTSHLDVGEVSRLIREQLFTGNQSTFSAPRRFH
jgi:shikimate kinase